MGAIKSKNKVALYPLESYLRHDWIVWKDYFLKCMTENYVPPYKQGDKFRKYIGNIGSEILKKFYFNSTSSETDINTLLFKFDVYFIFGGRRRHGNESINDYIQILKMIAEKTAEFNTEKVIKEKILQDLKTEQIFEQFMKIVPSFSQISDCESLNLHELLFIWKQCEKPQEIKLNLITLEARKRDVFETIQNKNKCLNCDSYHNDRKCPAFGKKCWKCEEFNHFARCCLKTYIMECCQCGSSHVQSKCPAYGAQCSRCKNMNHFAWQCFSNITLGCNFCGQSHIYGRQHCPANNSICNNCYSTGHYTFKCKSRRRSKSRH